MNRPLRFRAWDKRHGVMWPMADIDSEHGTASNGYALDGDSYEKRGSLDPDDDLVPMQFTGKQDAKGRDIYEGDTLRCANGSAGYIEWDEKSLGFKVNCNEPGWCHPIDGWDGSTAEVVGNIYENAELMEAA